MSEVIYTESCCAGSLCTALNLGDSSGSSLSVGVCRIKSNNQTKYVELPVEDSRTGVQFPPPPPTNEKLIRKGGLFRFAADRSRCSFSPSRKMRMPSKANARQVPGSACDRCTNIALCYIARVLNFTQSTT